MMGKWGWQKAETRPYFQNGKKRQNEAGERRNKALFDLSPA
jgi:hypothetical protein